MDQMLALRTFVTVANKRSFVEAARALGISPTAASRGVAGLEESLGVTLLRRTTRSVTLTPEGESYLDRCRRALEELDDAARAGWLYFMWGGPLVEQYLVLSGLR